CRLLASAGTQCIYRKPKVVFQNIQIVSGLDRQQPGGVERRRAVRTQTRYGRVAQAHHGAGFHVPRCPSRCIESQPAGDHEMQRAGAITLPIQDLTRLELRIAHGAAELCGDTRRRIRREKRAHEQLASYSILLRIPQVRHHFSLGARGSKSAPNAGASVTGSASAREALVAGRFDERGSERFMWYAAMARTASSSSVTSSFSAPE